MKSIDEKAKRYDEALKVAKNNYETIVQMDNDCTFAKDGIVNTFHHMFPELTESESEGERIRDIIYNRLQEYYINKRDTYFSVFDKDKCTEEWLEVKDWLEKQGEKGTNGNDREIPNSAWSEEDEKLLGLSISNLTELKDRFGKEYGRTGDCIEWLKSLKDRVQPQPKQEWDEEDEIYIENIRLAVEKQYPMAAKDIVDWLDKSIKDRVLPQSKQEWSEKDEKMLDGIIEASTHHCCLNIANREWLKSLKDRVGCEANCTTTKEWSEENKNRFNNLIFLVECSKENDATKEGFIRFINKLKSLRPHNTWKPSDEQMEALLKLEEMHVLEHEKNQENAHLYMVVKSLREQLNKLREEDV